MIEKLNTRVCVFLLILNCSTFLDVSEALLPNFDKSEALKAECSKSEFCCPIKISRQFSKQFIDRYNEKHWMDVQGI